MAHHAIIAACRPGQSDQDPSWPLLFADVTVRLFSSDEFPAEAKRQAARELPVDVGDRRALEDIAKSYEQVEAGSWSPSRSDQDTGR